MPLKLHAQPVLTWATMVAVILPLRVENPLWITLFGAGAGFLGRSCSPTPTPQTDRIGWFVIASTAGFAWLAVWQFLILPDDPVRMLHRSVQAFSRRAGEAIINAARGGMPPQHSRKTFSRSVDRVRSCRAMLAHQPHRPRLGVLVVSARHRALLPLKERCGRNRHETQDPLAPVVGVDVSASAGASGETQLVVGCDDGASLDLSIPQELIGLGGAF